MFTKSCFWIKRRCSVFLCTTYLSTPILPRENPAPRNFLLILGTAAWSLCAILLKEMDRRRPASPVYARQWSGGSSSTGSSSPAMSPAHPQSRLGTSSTIKRAQNVAAKKAAERLAQVMAQTPEDDDEDDDLNFRFAAPPPPRTHSSYQSVVNSNNTNSFHTISGPRINRSPSPAVIWYPCFLCFN